MPQRLMGTVKRGPVPSPWAGSEAEFYSVPQSFPVELDPSHPLRWPGLTGCLLSPLSPPRTPARALCPSEHSAHTRPPSSHVGPDSLHLVALPPRPASGRASCSATRHIRRHIHALAYRKKEREGRDTQGSDFLCVSKSCSHPFFPRVPGEPAATWEAGHVPS